MKSTTSTARRATLTFAMAGAVAFGTVALAPAASAAAPAPAVDGGYTVVEKSNGNGPAAFLITDKGKKPIFFCDGEKPNQRKNNCQPDPFAGEGRF